MYENNSSFVNFNIYFEETTPEIGQRYINTWGAISGPVLAPHFNEETLSISGLIVKDVLERTAKFGVENYLALQERCTNNWNFHNSFFFAGTVATTIGYGNITPATANGKLFCIIFTIIDTVRQPIVKKFQT